MGKSTIILVALLLSSCGISLASLRDSTLHFKFNSVIRQRGEYLDSYKKPRVEGEEPLLIAGQYTNIGFEFGYKGIKSYFSLQNGQAWGRKYGQGNTSIYQAWVDVPLGKSWQVKVGRQPLLLFGGWLFSTGRGSMMWKSWDMLQVNLHTGGLRMYAYGMVNAASLKETSQHYYDGELPFRYVAMLRSEYSFSKGLTLRSVIMDDWSQSSLHPARHYGRITAGLGAQFKLGKTLWGFVDGYYQCGEHIDKGAEKPLKLNAYAVNGMVNLRLAYWGHAYLGLHLMSGNPEGTDTRTDWRQFDRIVGAGHRIYSNMDYFNTKLSTLHGLGLWDSFIGTTVSLWTLKLDARVGVMTLDQVPETYDRFLCTVADFTCDYKINDWLSTQLCYSMMFDGEGMGKFYPDRLNDWGQSIWLTLQFNPSLSWHKKL